ASGATSAAASGVSSTASAAAVASSSTDAGSVTGTASSADFLRRENKAMPVSLIAAHPSPGPRRHPGLQLLDRGDLDEELLLPRGVEPDVRDPLRALTGDGVHPALAEVVVPDAISGGEFQIAVVANLRCHLVREAVHRRRQRLERAPQ